MAVWQATTTLTTLAIAAFKAGCAVHDPNCGAVAALGEGCSLPSVMRPGTWLGDVDRAVAAFNRRLDDAGDVGPRLDWSQHPGYCLIFLNGDSRLLGSYAFIKVPVLAARALAVGADILIVHNGFDTVFSRLAHAERRAESMAKVLDQPWPPPGHYGQLLPGGFVRLPPAVIEHLGVAEGDSMICTRDTAETVRLVPTRDVKTNQEE
jgi:hypothetical protein